MRIAPKINLSIASVLIIPIMIFWNPPFFSLMGVQPYWPLFWLLPWAIIYGSLDGFVAGLFLGLVLDAINNDFYTQIPGLVICGLWFGSLNDGKKNINKLKYGLLASLGTLICGIIYLLQIVLFGIHNEGVYLFSYAIKNIVSQFFLTGLLAPIFSSWLFFLFIKEKNQRYKSFHN